MPKVKFDLNLVRGIKTVSELDINDPEYLAKSTMIKVRQYLLPLLAGMDQEDTHRIALDLSKILKQNNIEKNKSLICFSNDEVFKYVSVNLLTKPLDRNQMYCLIEDGDLRDIWGGNSVLLYDKMFNRDMISKYRGILIVRLTSDGYRTDKQLDFTRGALVELMRSRLSFGKPTWIFYEDKEEQFNLDFGNLLNKIKIQKINLYNYNIL